MVDAATVKAVAKLLSISPEQAERIEQLAITLYRQRMSARFSELRLSERLKRTNPFLTRIRGFSTVEQWAQAQVQSALIASEEEAVGHLLEQIAMVCFPNSQNPTYPDDFDLEVASDETVDGYQIKMSWDCMPMSSRKNLSSTITKLTEFYARMGKKFTGYFASCYGKATTTTPPGQKYIALRSREFWQRVGSGDADYDYKVGEACALLCADARKELYSTLVPKLVSDLTTAALPVIGNPDGTIDYQKLFRRINK